MEPARNVKDVSPHEIRQGIRRSPQSAPARTERLNVSMQQGCFLADMELPEWTDIVKINWKTEKSLPHTTLIASMARKVYLRGGIGVGGFRRIYGGNQRNGSRPRHFCKSSGSVARHILQQLQTMKRHHGALTPRGTGRRITSNGQRDLDQVAGRITAAN
ncbi:40S ribosomal protein S19 [Datura stramonium]|uniref:40S ribosomal protein S19 n=1 Tax=Datura stramonium TaxID=4076 RepID=A0ABS8SH41_DATST|nr:40S ribosomal protein S19 [Datura stramonium]